MIWFKDSLKEDNKFYCGNPKCRGLINEGIMYFCEEFSEIYHPNDSCLRIAIVYKTIEKGEAIFSEPELITRRIAAKLLKDGKIKQGNIEEKLE